MSRQYNNFGDAPSFAEESDFISRWIDRGRAKGHRQRADVWDASTEAVNAYRRNLYAREDLARTINRLINVLPEELAAETERGIAEAYKIRLEAKHGIAMLELDHAMALENKANELQRLRELAAPKPAAALPPPPPPPPPPAASAPDAPRQPPKPQPNITIQAGFTPEDVSKVLESIPEITPDTRTVALELLAAYLKEKKP